MEENNQESREIVAQSFKYLYLLERETVSLFYLTSFFSLCLNLFTFYVYILAPTYVTTYESG